MNLVFFTHPAWFRQKSQERFVRMLADGCAARGHRTEVRQPRERLRRLVDRPGLGKWAGYVDQFVFFPAEIRRRLASDPAETLYVFCDQALGPWVPAVADRPHVVHCLDLLALRSALGQVPENPTSWTGRIYQRYIRAGFRHAKHFVSISDKTRSDLHAFGGVRPWTTEMVYNGLSHPYAPLAPDIAGARLAAAGLDVPPRGILLHVGGGQWYKNTRGVIALYAAYVARAERAGGGRAVLPLWLVSPPPSGELRAAVEALPAAAAVRFIQGVDDATLHALYASARALVFPSLAEGFGWPIAEALACGCPVITTGEAPMSEVGGAEAIYLPRLAADADLRSWAERGAESLLVVLDRSAAERALAASRAIAWAGRYDADRALDRYISIYEDVLGRSLLAATDMEPAT